MSILETVPENELHYARQRHKNHIFTALVSFIARQAEMREFTQRDIAEALDRDQALISRWLRYPSNLTIETISDLLTAVGGELDVEVVAFQDAGIANYMHPLLESIVAESEGPGSVDETVSEPSGRELTRLRPQLSPAGSDGNGGQFVDAS